MLSIQIDRNARRTRVRASGELRSDADSDALVDALQLVPASDDLVVDVTELALPAPCARRLRACVAERATHAEVVVVADDEAAGHLVAGHDGDGDWTVTTREHATSVLGDGGSPGAGCD